MSLCFYYGCVIVESCQCCSTKTMQYLPNLHFSDPLLTYSITIVKSIISPQPACAIYTKSTPVCVHPYRGTGADPQFGEVWHVPQTK